MRSEDSGTVALSPAEIQASYNSSLYNLSGEFAGLQRIPILLRLLSDTRGVQSRRETRTSGCRYNHNHDTVAPELSTQLSPDNGNATKTRLTISLGQ